MKKRLLLLMIFIFLTGCNPFESSKQVNQPFQKVEINHELLESSQSKTDLYVLGKVWGFLKYYHPNVMKGQFDWDKELLKILPDILKSESVKDRDMVLLNWISTLGEFEEEKIEIDDKEVILSPDLNWVTDLNFNKELEDKLIHIKNAKRPGSNKYVSLAEHIGNPVFNEKSYSDMSYPDDGIRLLALYRYWNIIEYYFPYRNLIEEDWDLVLQEFIPKFITASNEMEYKLYTLEIIGRIHDTHANIWPEDSTLEQYWGVNAAPIRLTFVEEKPVVTGYYSFGEESGLKIGDIITKINNKAIEEILEDKLKYIPASNYSTKLRDLALKLLRSNDDYITVDYVRNGKAFQTEVEVNALAVSEMKNKNLEYLDRENYQLLNSNIAYLYVGNIFNSDIPEIMGKVEGTKGLIIDLRCYPADYILFHLGEYLMPQSTLFTKISGTSIQRPGLFRNIMNLEVGKNNTNYYKGKVVILINEQTLSLAEFTAMALRKAPNAVVIGSTTAGADGDVSSFMLPGGINTAISGIGVYNPDGSETQRVGILPDIEVFPTIEGIKANKDEVLERAIDIINKEK